MKNNDTLISVVIPAYNAEKYIDFTLDSVINQTYKELEIIVINDCSQDNTEKIIDEYVKKDKRIKKVNNKKNRGVSYTRNYGIKLAKGKWIAFLDSDDVWEDDKIEKQINFAIDNNVGFVFTASSFIDEDGDAYSHIMQVPCKISYKELLKQNVISCSSVLIKKEYITGVKIPSDKIHEDFAIWLMILKDRDINAYGINEPLLVYRISKKSKSGDKKKAALMTYGVYKYVGLNIFKRVYYMTHYILRSLKKYKKIKSS